MNDVIIISYRLQKPQNYWGWTRTNLLFIWEYAQPHWTPQVPADLSGEIELLKFYFEWLPNAPIPTGLDLDDWDDGVLATIADAIELGLQDIRSALQMEILPDDPWWLEMNLGFGKSLLDLLRRHLASAPVDRKTTNSRRRLEQEFGRRAAPDE